MFCEVVDSKYFVLLMVSARHFPQQIAQVDETCAAGIFYHIYICFLQFIFKESVTVGYDELSERVKKFRSRATREVSFVFVDERIFTFKLCGVVISMISIATFCFWLS